MMGGDKMSKEKQRGLFNEIRESLVNFDVEAVKKLALDAIRSGISAEEIIGVMSEGMEIIGERYQAGEIFVTELVIAGETMKEVLEVLEPYMEGEAGGKLGTAVVATVEGDLHDIGKNIFVMLMTTAGFKVIDLGVDVSAERIVEAVGDSQADILGLSALLTTNLEQFPMVVDRLKREGLREKVKVIVGGATVTEEYAKEAGVDAYAKTALDGAEICKGWIKDIRS